MRYYGGGIGHLNNAPPQQADPLDPDSDEMAVEEDEEFEDSNAGDGPQDVLMNDGELEVDEGDGSGDDNDDGDQYDNRDYDDNDESDDEEGDEDGDADEDANSTCSGDDDEVATYGYASP